MSQKIENPSTCNSSGGQTMETAPTQDVADGFLSDDESQEEVWGRFFPLGTSFYALDFTKDQYTFGRGDTCDYPFNTAAMKQHKCFQAYSKVHFTIFRENTSTGMHVFLEDRSSNGTFINGEKVGKNNRQALNNNDEVALSIKKNKAFVFMDVTQGEDMSLPPEIREKYTMSKTLGRGACGEVKLAFEKGSCKKFAVKIISKKKFTIGGNHHVNLANQVMTEVKILKSLKHACIIAIEDVIDTQDTLFIVLELVEGGELFDRVTSLGQIKEATAKLLFYQMVLAIKYLHDQDITHRDLKPENILLACDGDETLVKVTDFGLSKFVDANTMMKTFCGTPNYLAPEILKTAGMGKYNNKVDCWALGVILFIMLAGYPPFTEERKDMDLPKQIMGGHYDFPKVHWKGISNTAIDLIKQLMKVKPADRISMEKALEHPWLKDNEMKNKADAIIKAANAQRGEMPPPAVNAVSPRKRSASASNGSEENDTKRKSLKTPPIEDS